MSRYVEAMARHVEAGDTHGAGLVAWRLWAGERREWARERGLTYPEARDLLGPTSGPDYSWLMRTYGMDAPSIWPGVRHG
ncbi:hypothetical protein [Nonomuraea wenchangensis]|uniref:hypothetical protein n=1 Tax=Nonomuraea wenchangensis TaxID=568860 RepID=UPI0033FF0130